MSSFAIGSLATLIVGLVHDHQEQEYENDDGIFELSQLIVTDYNAYLQSYGWKEKAKEARIRANYRCMMCYEPGKLSVHHRTYDRIGHELNTDLIVLCRKCHALFHDKLPEQPDLSPKEIPF